MGRGAEADVLRKVLSALEENIDLTTAGGASPALRSAVQHAAAL
jgi:hypothetical protein